MVKWNATLSFLFSYLHYPNKIGEKHSLFSFIHPSYHNHFFSFFLIYLSNHNHFFSDLTTRSKWICYPYFFPRMIKRHFFLGYLSVYKRVLYILLCIEFVGDWLLLYFLSFVCNFLGFCDYWFDLYSLFTVFGICGFLVVKFVSIFSTTFLLH